MLNESPNMATYYMMPCYWGGLFLCSSLSSLSAALPALSPHRTRSRFGWWLQLALSAAPCLSLFQHCMKNPCLSCPHPPLLWLPVPNLEAACVDKSKSSSLLGIPLSHHSPLLLLPVPDLQVRLNFADGCFQYNIHNAIEKANTSQRN